MTSCHIKTTSQNGFASIALDGFFDRIML